MTTPTTGKPDQVSSNTETVVRNASITSVAVAMSRVTGLVREKVMAYFFGAGGVYDAFLVAFRIPNLTRDLFAEGALSSAFVPVFTEYLQKGDRKEAAKLANLVATSLIVFVGSFCALGMIFAPQIVTLFASGFAKTPEKLALTIRMTQLMFPFLLLVSEAALAMGILNACNRFAIPAMSSTMFNIGSVVFGLIIGFWLGPQFGFERIIGMAFGVLLGGALQLAWQVPELIRQGFRFKAQVDLNHEGFVRILKMMGPALLGNSAVQVNVLINTHFASEIIDPIRGPEGPVSWLQYAFRFMQLPLGIFGVAIGSATMATVSRLAALKDFEEFRETVARSMGVVFLLTIPSSIGLLVLGESIIGAIYQDGKFTDYDTQQTGKALGFYAIGLAGYSAVKILNPAFYALGDSRTPMIVSLCSILINFGTVWTLTHHFRYGHEGLALSTSVVALVSFISLGLILRAKLNGIHGWRVVSSIMRTLCASMIMGGAVAASSALVHRLLPVGRWVTFIDLLISLPIGLVVFWFAAQWFKVQELEVTSNTFLKPLQSRFPILRPKVAAKAD
jgi:putative peptidoglycan lipid II flippase